MIHLLNTKTKVLVVTGRYSEARSIRAEASKEATNYPTEYSRIHGYNVLYERFEDRLSVVAKKIK